MKIKKTYARPSVGKTTIDKEISMVMMSPLVSVSPAGLLKWLK
jgi:hypothetical protein